MEVMCFNKSAKLYDGNTGKLVNINNNNNNNIPPNNKTSTQVKILTKNKIQDFITSINLILPYQTTQHSIFKVIQ